MNKGKGRRRKHFTSTQPAERLRQSLIQLVLPPSNRRGFAVDNPRRSEQLSAAKAQTAQPGDCPWAQPGMADVTAARRKASLASRWLSWLSRSRPAVHPPCPARGLVSRGRVDGAFALVLWTAGGGHKRWRSIAALRTGLPPNPSHAGRPQRAPGLSPEEQLHRGPACF